MAKLSDLQNFYDNRKKDKPLNPHAGHRNRLKERFVKEGSLDNFEPHNVLEMLLFFAVPQRDTNPLAHELIRTFGGFREVFKAPLRQLASVKGMTRNAALLIKLIPEVYRKYLNEPVKDDVILNSPEKFEAYLVPKFAGLSEEVVYLLCFNENGKLIKEEMTGKGTQNTANIDVRKILEIVISCNASSVVLAHNHPDGRKNPSASDKASTRRLETVLASIGVEITDHFIIAEGELISMVELGFLATKSIIELPYIDLTKI